MKKQSARLLLFTLLLVMLYGGSILASRPTNAALNSPQDCKEGCAQRRDAMMKRCEGLSSDRKTSCQNTVNDQYNKCVQNCDSYGKGGDGSKTP
jgi:hypothetical protein